jgi:hypothetical protein
MIEFFSNSFVFEVLKAVTLKRPIFLAVTPCNLIFYRCFGGTYYSHLGSRRVRQTSNQQEAIKNGAVLKMEAISSSETSAGLSAFHVLS